MPRIVEKVPDKLPSEITSLKDMFRGTIFFNQNISSWNITNVVKMNAMFADAILFNQDISHWNTINVIYMNSVFAGAASFNQNLSWNITKVKDMSAMFMVQ